MVEWSSQTNTSPLGARAFSTPTLPGSVATIAEKAAGVMVNRITRPISVRAVLNVSRMKAPAPDWRRRGGESRTPVPTADDAGAYARASEGLPSAPARTRRRSNCSGSCGSTKTPALWIANAGADARALKGEKRAGTNSTAPRLFLPRPRRESRTPAPSNERGGRRGFVTASQKRDKNARRHELDGAPIVPARLP